MKISYLFLFLQSPNTYCDFGKTSSATYRSNLSNITQQPWWNCWWSWSVNCFPCRKKNVGIVSFLGSSNILTSPKTFPCIILRFVCIVDFTALKYVASLLFVAYPSFGNMVNVFRFSSNKTLILYHFRTLLVPFYMKTKMTPLLISSISHYKTDYLFHSQNHFVLMAPYVYWY